MMHGPLNVIYGLVCCDTSFVGGYRDFGGKWCCCLQGCSVMSNLILKMWFGDKGRMQGRQQQPSGGGIECSLGQQE
jgi:hypothetical protein